MQEADTQALISAITPLAQRARAFLEPRFVDYRVGRELELQVPLSTGNCEAASEFLSELLRDEVDWVSLGLADLCVYPGYAQCWNHPLERYCAHYAVTACRAKKREPHFNVLVVADVTFDQFDRVSEVVVEPYAAGTRYHHLRPNGAMEESDGWRDENRVLGHIWYADYRGVSPDKNLISIDAELKAIRLQAKIEREAWLEGSLQNDELADVLADLDDDDGRYARPVAED